MKQLLLVAITLAFNLIISACSDGGGNPEQSNKQLQTDSVQRLSAEVLLSAEATKTNDGRIAVTGKTNLPDGTELIISISEEVFGFSAQDESMVAKGEFSAGPLGPKSGLSAGNYIIEVMMPIPSAQPESVQSIIGNEGQYLTGALVKQSSWGGKTVEYSFSYSLGSKESIQQAQSVHYKLVSNVRSTIEQLLENGRAMDRYRNTDDLVALKNCGERMRENQAKAKAIRAQAETLSMNYMGLKVASIEIFSCVSCSGTAIEACERVAESLKNSR